jgi:diguanylate cyclase (GGDEF)-like protein
MDSVAAALDRRRDERHRRSMAEGGWWGLGTMGVALPYALLVGGPHQRWLIGAAACGVVMSIALGVCASVLRFGPRWRRPVMLSYSAAHVVITVIVAIADGGADSPMALGFFGTVTFGAYTMPPRIMVAYGALNVLGYGTVYAVAGAHRPEYVPVALAGLLATAAACALQHNSLVRQRRKLTAMARTDPLTRCLNRRGFEERLAVALAAAVRDAADFAVLVVDLDEFKATNDGHGHAAGDRVLIDTVAVMRSVFGDEAIVGRLGGDEFALVLPLDAAQTPEIRAAELATRLNQRAPASVGTAVLGADGDTAEALLLAADRRLYAHKSRRKLARAA